MCSCIALHGLAPDSGLFESAPGKVDAQSADRKARRCCCAELTVCAA